MTSLKPEDGFYELGTEGRVKAFYKRDTREIVFIIENHGYPIKGDSLSEVFDLVGDLDQYQGTTTAEEIKLIMWNCLGADEAIEQFEYNLDKFGSLS